MKDRININPDKVTKEMILKSLYWKLQTQTAKTERRAQIGNYCEPAWNRRGMSYTLANLIDQNQNN